RRCSSQCRRLRLPSPPPTGLEDLPEDPLHAHSVPSSSSSSPLIRSAGSESPMHDIRPTSTRIPLLSASPSSPISQPVSQTSPREPVPSAKLVYSTD